MAKHTLVGFVALSLATIAGCSGGGARPDTSSLCGKASSTLAGIVLLEAKHGNDPEILDTYQSELTARCKAAKAEETDRDALQCYVDNRKARGYFLFKSCPEQPGKALIAAVVALHGAR